ncbi:MAG: EVE domain-containing protein [Pelagibacteraceae bacterium]|nr:EVE domain-containing protein [Pelagibacteraceae bacterium]
MKNNIETDYLIFVSSDGKKNGYDIFNDRISQNLWPIYVKTPQLINVKVGKKIIFYIAGNGINSQNFVASGIIDKIEDQRNTNSDPNQEFKQILFNVKFRDIKKFVNYINIKEHLNNLSFIEKNKRKIYGLYFQGGVCKINKQSYEYIIKQS